ncbi:MAG: KilA-N domain-containing protein [Dysgonamonadaceae bacterium]|jgi:hypothetical protein|nr:KilA-N domain-containing protein [Dysgonamonadaceae bacterium]
MKQKENNQVPAVINFDYEGNPVSFTMDGKVMVNATQMAKPFGKAKSPQFWLKTQSAKEFLEVLSEARIFASEKLVIVKKGGVVQGTWMHEDVALEFSRWLSPKFSIWCNDRIKELLTKGQQQTELPPPDNNQVPESTIKNIMILMVSMYNDSFLKNMEEFHKIFSKTEERIQNRMNVIELKLQEKLAIPATQSDYEMDMIWVNFQMPMYLNNKMIEYCTERRMKQREFLNNLVAAELLTK